MERTRERRFIRTRCVMLKRNGWRGNRRRRCCNSTRRGWRSWRRMTPCWSAFRRLTGHWCGFCGKRRVASVGFSAIRCGTFSTWRAGGVGRGRRSGRGERGGGFNWQSGILERENFRGMACNWRVKGCGSLASSGLAPRWDGWGGAGKRWRSTKGGQRIAERAAAKKFWTRNFSKQSGARFR